MLNGKFFVGLPVKMMDNRGAPNRQESHFFWPDESKMEAAVDTRTKLRHKSRLERTPERTVAKDYNTNDLQKRELTSKIDLDEHQLKRNDNNFPVKQSNLRRRDTFSSNIKFYDYDNEAAPTPPRMNKNSKIEVEKNLKNSPKTSDKRISFTEDKNQQKMQSMQGILKNNETTTKLAPSTLPRRPTIKNLNKSKSMTNISCNDKVKTIENNVKNISISKRSNYDFNEAEEEYIAPPRREIRTMSRPIPPPRRSRPVTEYYDDIDDYYYSEQKRSPITSQKIINYQKTFRNVDPEPDFEDTYITTKDNRGRMQASHQYYAHREDHRHINRGKDYDDDYRYETRRSVIPKRTFARESINIKKNNNDVYTSRSQEAQIFNPPAADVVDDHNIDEGQKPNNIKHNTRSHTMTPPNISRTPSRAHRHLVSNVAFWSDNESNGNNNSHTRTIRNSAVSRVSVGLPDT